MSGPPDRILLVVEDSQVQRDHLVELLGRLCPGTVLQAADGLEALRLLDQQDRRPVFLLLTDIDMPGMDGIELIGRLTERRCVDNLIAMSARDPRLLETVERLCAGAALHLLGTLTKPISAEALGRLLLDARQQLDRPAAAGADALDLQDIRAGLAAGQFVPYVQPKVAVRTGRLKGVEVLARWRHPQRGVVAPAAFIPQIEGTPLMAQLTLAMVEQSLRWFKEWRFALPGLGLSLNLSADDLADKGFVDRLTALVEQQGVAPPSLVWEVTETMLMSNQALANLARLGLKGFGLSMDDYGIGYSSMQTLLRSPFTELKIDRIFVDGAAERRNRHAILVSSLDMGRRLGVATVAEGVEALADWRLLSQLGCDTAQGYLIARPMPAEELFGWARANRPRLRALAADGRREAQPASR